MRNTLKAKYSVFRTLGKQSNLRNRQKINRRERKRKKKHTRKCIWRWCWFGDIPLWSRLTTFLTLLQPSRVSIHLAGSHRLEREPCRTSWGLWIALASPLLFVRVFPFLSLSLFLFSFHSSFPFCLRLPCISSVVLWFLKICSVFSFSFYAILYRVFFLVLILLCYSQLFLGPSYILYHSIFSYFHFHFLYLIPAINLSFSYFPVYPSP